MVTTESTINGISAKAEPIDDSTTNPEKRPMKEYVDCDGFVTWVPASARIMLRVSMVENAVLGDDVYIGQDTRVGELVQIGDGALIGASVHIGRRVIIGAGAKIADGVRLPAELVVPAGATVTAGQDGTLIITPPA